MTTRMPYARRGFTLMELTIVSGLMAFLVLLISSAWTSIGRSSTDLITRGQLVQEMNFAAATLTRDLGGNLPDSDSRVGTKKQGQWVGWLQPGNSQLWLCYDGGTDPNGVADWASPDTVVRYYLSNDPDVKLTTKVLIREDQKAGTTYTVAKYLDPSGFQVFADTADTIRIVLTFQYRKLTRTCTVTARTP
jgi:prepilin-type N-terminal cleavage/methylation domain-containing protein